MNWDRVLYPLDLVGCNLLGRRFVGAVDIDGVLEVGKDLKKRGFGVTYNLLGEHVHDLVPVDKAVDSTLRLIRGMQNENLGNVSCKPTLYGLSISKTLFIKNIEEIIELARQKEIEIEFDAENYSYIEDTFDVFSSFASQKIYSNTVRQAVQAHLKDILPLMGKYQLWDKSLRIVKGAGVYNETNTSIVTNDNEKIRQKYFEILRGNIVAGRTPFTATVRDRELAESVIKITGEGASLFEFQMLYGPLGRKLGECLLRSDYPVRVYIPFTDYWCHDVWKSYGLRRAKMMRNLLLSNFKCATLDRIGKGH